MSARTRLLIASVSTLLIAYVAVGSLLGRVMGDSTYGQLSIFNEVTHFVRDAYVDPVNMERAMSSANLGLTEALDGDSGYLDDAAFRTYQQPLSHEEAAEIGVTLTRRFSFVMVVSTREGSPGRKAGLRPGDLLKTIDGRHSRLIPAPVAERMLRGAPGSTVKLAVLRGRVEPLEISVVRERLQPVPPDARLLEQGPGYVKIAEFAPRTADDVRGDIETLRHDGAKSLVLDLRGAAAGSAEEAVKVAGLFLESGIVARLTGRKHPEQIWQAERASQAWDLPVAVLIDKGTAGPAEIVAAALNDAGRGPLVGERTFGRAAIQKAIPLSEGGLVLTVARYLTPKGNPIHGHGVEPTTAVDVPDLDDAPPDPSKPAADPILDKAVELLKAPAAERKAA